MTDLSTAAPSVGGILLTQGLVSEEQLEEAQLAQQRTGKPVGQILVEWGAITRLELASALAEQWSYAGASPLRRPGEPRLEEVEVELTQAQAELLAAEPPPAHPVADAATVARVDALETSLRELRDREDDATIAQFREAMVDLARRVGASEPLLSELSTKAERAAASEEKLAEIALAVEASLQRLGAVEAGMGDVGTRIADVSANLGQAIADLDRRFGVGAGELAELARRLERAADSGSLDQLRLRVEQLAARPVGDPELHETVQRLAARVEGGPDAGAITELRGALDGLATRIAAADDLAARVDELAQLVQRLPEGTGEGRSEVSQAAVIELRSRIEQLSHRADESIAAAAAAQASAVDELRATVRELAARPDPGAALSERLEQIASRVDAVAARDDRPALDELRAAVDQLASRPAGDPVLPGRLDELSARLEELGGRFDGIAAATYADDSRAAVEELRGELRVLSARPVVDPELADRVNAIAARVDVLSDVVKDAPEPGPGAGALDDVRQQLASAEQSSAQRFDELVARLGRLEQERATSTSTADAGAVSEQIERATTSWAATQETLAGRVDQLELRLRDAAALAAESARSRSAIVEGTPVPGVSTGGGLEQEFDRLMMAIERLSLRIGEHDRALGELMRGGASAPRVAELAGRIAELELRGGGGGVPGGGGGEAIGGGALLAVAGRLEEVENARKADREKLFTQIERMASALDWRLQRLEAANGAATTAS